MCVRFTDRTDFSIDRPGKKMCTVENRRCFFYLFLSFQIRLTNFPAPSIQLKLIEQKIKFTI